MKTRLSPSEIQALVEREVGPVSQLEQLAEGLASQAYGFWLGAAQYVVRVGRSADGYRKDAFAWHKFSSAALPIPEVIRVDTLGEVSVCISRRASGARITDVGDDLADLSSRVVDILAELGRTDTSPTTGFGSFDAQGKAPHQRWSEYLLNVSQPNFCDWSLIGDRSERRHVEAAIRMIEGLAPADPPGRGLIHGDFGAANLISDGRTVTAIIDWDRAMIGDVAYDQANIFFWGEARLEAARSILTHQHSGDHAWARRIRCYQLHICLQELSESLTGLTPVDPGWLLARCADLTEKA